MMPTRNADTRLTDAYETLFKNGGVKYGYYMQDGYKGTSVFLYQQDKNYMWREGTERGKPKTVVTAAEAKTAAVGIDCSNSFQQAGLKAGFNWGYLSTSEIVNGSGDLTSAGAQRFDKIEGLKLSAVIDTAKGESNIYQGTSINRYFHPNPCHSGFIFSVFAGICLNIVRNTPTKRGFPEKSPLF